MNADPTSLDRLHDIVVPPPVPWWPPAPAWYWVIGLLLLLALVLVLRALLNWLHNTYRREALAEFARQEATLTDPQQRAAAITNMTEVLKRTAITAFPRESVASLTGSAWSVFLAHTNGRRVAAPSGLIESLERVAYQPDFADQLNESQIHDFTKFARQWIGHHRTDDFGAASDLPNNEIGPGTRTRDEKETRC